MKHRAKMDLSLPGKAKSGFDRRGIPCKPWRIEIVVSTQPGGLRSIFVRCFMKNQGNVAVSRVTRLDAILDVECGQASGVQGVLKVVYRVSRWASPPCCVRAVMVLEPPIYSTIICICSTTLLYVYAVRPYAKSHEVRLKMKSGSWQAADPDVRNPGSWSKGGPYTPWTRIPRGRKTPAAQFSKALSIRDARSALLINPTASS